MEEQRTQRMVMAGVMALAALLGLAFVSGGSATSDAGAARAADQPTELVDADATPTSTTTSARAASTTAAPAPTTTTTTATATASTEDPGALPQNDEKPTATGGTFTEGVNALWEAIRQDKPELGLPFFFPKNAYLQVKAISDPATDYQNRLIANFEDDVHALHGQLGPGAASAQFVGIDVPSDQAVLVQPGEESNKLSYWRVYGTTLQYQIDGQTSSFPVTSLISWRGQWYVVHLGAIR